MMEIVLDGPQDEVRNEADAGRPRDEIQVDDDTQRRWAIRMVVVAMLLLVGAIVFRVLLDDDSAVAPEAAVEVRGELADIIVHVTVDPASEDMQALIGTIARVPGVAAAEFSPAAVITGVAPGAETVPIGEDVIGVRLEDGADIDVVISLLENILEVERAETRE